MAELSSARCALSSTRSSDLCANKQFKWTVPFIVHNRAMRQVLLFDYLIILQMREQHCKDYVIRVKQLVSGSDRICLDNSVWCLLTS